MAIDSDIEASYREALDRTGRPVTIVRLTGYAPHVTRKQAQVKANIQGFSGAPGESYSGPGAIPEGTRRVIVLAADLVAEDFPLPLVDGDKLLLDDESLDIGDIDAETRRLAGAIQFQVTGVK